MTKTATQEYFTRTEAAEYLRLSPKTIDRLVHSGHLRAKQLGRDEHGNPTGRFRFSRKALDAYFDGLADS